MFDFADESLIGDDFRGVETNTDVLLNIYKDIGTVLNTGKAKCVEIRNRDLVENEHIIHMQYI